MTEEELLQSLVDASLKYSSFPHLRVPYADGYIDGAHSRDEEIEELEFKIMKLKHERDFYRSAYRLCQRKK